MKLAQTADPSLLTKTLIDALLSLRHDVKTVQEVLIIRPSKLHDVAVSLKQELLFDVLVDVVAVDYLGKKDLRFELNYLFYSSRYNKRIQIKTQVSDNKNPTIESLTDLYTAADWAERECAETTGIVFDDGLPRRFTPRNDGQDNNADLHTSMTLDDNLITGARFQIDSTHRLFESHEKKTSYLSLVPIVEHWNVDSAPINAAGYCKAIEDFLGVKIPERATLIRVILCELTRIFDHLHCMGCTATSMEFPIILKCVDLLREKFFAFSENICGARFPCSFIRLGGLVRDAKASFVNDLNVLLKEVQKTLKDLRSLTLNNFIFMKRTQGVGVIPRAQALDMGLTGPTLRASGVAYDVRKLEPYFLYDTFDFEIPIGETGDAYDRMNVRFTEIDQSLRIIGQALKRLTPGPVMTDDQRVAFPNKDFLLSDPEALAQHTRLIEEGVCPDVGEIYSRTESANGELGYFVVSDGTKAPYRLKLHTPTFQLAAAFEKILVGNKLEDAAVISTSMNLRTSDVERFRP